MFTDPILAKIEKYLLAKPISATVFGLRVAKDGHLVFRLRAGRELRLRLRNKVKTYMASNK